jgi:uncharacterized protein (DUF433 family)
VARLDRLARLADEPRLAPAYGLAEAARYLQLPTRTLQDWIYGRHYLAEGRRKFFRPLIEIPVRRKPFLSFVNLVEAYVLGALRREHDVPMWKVRRALDYVQKHFQRRHPLAYKWFQTDGVDVFVERYGSIIDVGSSGQLAIADLLRNRLRRIEHDADGIAARVYLFTRRCAPHEEAGEPRLVVVDPLRGFGQPVVEGTGIPVTAIAERFDAGDKMEDLVADYRLEPSQVLEAVRCGGYLKAA